MSRREAGLILGISPAANPQKIKQAHKRIMLLNHPDRGMIVVIKEPFSDKNVLQADHLTWQPRSMKPRTIWILESDYDDTQAFISLSMPCS